MKLFNDASEPCFLVSGVMGLASGVYALIVGASYWIAASFCLCGTSTLACQRAHSLGLAKSVAESAETLREENTRLIASVDDLEKQNSDFRESVGALESRVQDLGQIGELLEGTEKDLEEVERRLRGLLAGIRGENKKHQNNNLVSLFSIVDQNRNSVLNREEVARLAEYVESVYERTIDFDALDRDGDGSLTLSEFIRLFNLDSMKN